MSLCENRKRRIENFENAEKKRKVKENSAEDEHHAVWKLENDDVTNCILNSWLNENAERELEVFVDTYALDTESVTCADFTEESTFQDYGVCNDSTFTVSAHRGCEDEESEEEICAGTVPEACDFDTGSEIEYSESDDEDEEIERKVLILDLDNTLIHCSRDLDGQLEIQLPQNHCHETQESMQLHNLDEILKSANEAILDDFQHLYYVEASKINHVEEDSGLFVFKLRPGVIKFLRACAKMYELAICTMGTADYALWVKAMLERASGVEFTAGVLSREDFRVAGQKRFDSAWPEDGAIIVDDRRDVWSDYERNLIQINPFSFFSEQKAVSACGLSLQETLQLLGELHQTTLQDPSQDVRDILEIIS